MEGGKWEGGEGRETKEGKSRDGRRPIIYGGSIKNPKSFSDNQSCLGTVVIVITWLSVL